MSRADPSPPVFNEKPGGKEEEKQEEKSSAQKVHNLEVSGGVR